MVAVDNNTMLNVLMQFGIAGIILYMFYKYVQYVTKKTMNDIVDKLETIITNEKEIIMDLKLILSKLNEEERR